MTLLTGGKFAVGISLINRLSISMKFMAIVASDTLKSKLLMKIRFGTRCHSQESMSTSGNVAGYTYIKHMGSLIKIMAG
jgi:hypothetical protein